jgi:hypothetical protein
MFRLPVASPTLPMGPAICLSDVAYGAPRHANAAACECELFLSIRHRLALTLTIGLRAGGQGQWHDGIQRVSSLRVRGFHGPTDQGGVADSGRGSTNLVAMPFAFAARAALSARIEWWP